MSKLDLFKKYISGKNIAILGVGISNVPLAEYLSGLNANIVCCDKREKAQLGDTYEKLSALGVKWQLGENYLENLNGQDIIFKTPGMRFDIPELVSARNSGVIVTSEMEAFFELCPARIIGVTGSDGKTTTTTLIYKMLMQQGYTVWVGGNIGRPLLGEIDNIKKEHFVVLELSSFQLHTMKKSPNISVITNISPNHLDMHKDYDEYISAKENIMRYQNKSDKLIVNYDNDVTRRIGENAVGKCEYFSYANKKDIYIDSDYICINGEKILNINDIKIPGRYNTENYMAAIGAVYDYVSANAIVSIAKTFNGVAHRTEFVREINGIKFYNSSIDSSPNRTKNTLSVFDEKVILICGGKQKGIPYDELGEVLTEKVKVLILLGASAKDIEMSLKRQIELTGKGRDIQVIHADSYEYAVETAFNTAKSGDNVILSPASTSFDMFRNFEERGELFKKLVWNL